MEKIPVRVRIHTRQTLEDGTSQTFTLSEQGHLYLKDNALYIAYREAGEDGQTTQTTWKIEPSQASLIRQGAAGMKALFRRGAADATQFITPHGSLPLEIRTFRLENRLSRAGGRLRVGYQMLLAGSVSRMEVELRVDTLNKTNGKGD
ncbi:DUF1934 domain-containing protein [Effusibacillus pohliae]|uniref:DUF1934 domain-containing protein n=1 Tax=Effusibacillus pohliae TaxID=232270 RepID=UPI00036CE026|nr:DUF1934 domain-containing protein [Effusibacillus pohliae]